MKSLKELKKEQQERYYKRVQQRNVKPCVDKNDSWESFNKDYFKFRVRHP